MDKFALPMHLDYRTSSVLSATFSTKIYSGNPCIYRSRSFAQEGIWWQGMF